MHVEKRKVGKRTKYYLAHTLRIQKKFKKMRVYLGLSESEANKKRPEAERIIKERIAVYETISDPFRNVITPSELDEVRTLVAKGEVKIGHLSEDDWRIFTESFVYNTNAIEGSSVTPDEVKDILEKEQWPKEREKWEISETYGLSDAVNYIRNTKEHVSLQLIKELHRIVFKNSKSFAGAFRKRGQEVVVVNSLGEVIHRGAPSTTVVKLLKDLVAWYDKSRDKYPAIVLATVVHNQFETIHPFADGNGRVGRLLLNNILLKHNKPPVNIELKNRKEYYAVLNEYQNTGNIRPTIELILREYRSFKKMLKR